MRVYLGPYPNWWTTTRFENWVNRKVHKVEYGWQVEEEDYTRFEKVIFKACDVWQTVLNNTVNKFGQKRKEKVRIDRYDTWSMDNTLALIILPMLKQLKEDKHGSPFVDDKDVPVALRSTSAKKLTKREKATGQTDELFHKRWEWVLDEMIWVFEQKIDPNEGRSNYYDPYKPDEKVLRAGFIDAKTGEKSYFMSEDETRKMGKLNKTKYQKYLKRKQNAFILFGKYYEGLWD